MATEELALVEEKKELLIDDPNHSDPSDAAWQVSDIESNHDKEKEAFVNNNEQQENKEDFVIFYDRLVSNWTMFDLNGIIMVNDDYVDNFKWKLQNPWILACGCCTCWFCAHTLMIMGLISHIVFLLHAILRSVHDCNDLGQGFDLKGRALFGSRYDLEPDALFNVIHCISLIIDTIGLHGIRHCKPKLIFLFILWFWIKTLISTFFLSSQQEITHQLIFLDVVILFHYACIFCKIYRLSKFYVNSAQGWTLLYVLEISISFVIWNHQLISTCFFLNFFFSLSKTF